MFFKQHTELYPAMMMISTILITMLSVWKKRSVWFVRFEMKTSLLILQIWWYQREPPSKKLKSISSPLSSEAVFLSTESWGDQYFQVRPHLPPFPYDVNAAFCLEESFPASGKRQVRGVRSRGRRWVCTTWPSPCWGQSLWVWAWCRPGSSSHAVTQRWARSAEAPAGPGFPCCSHCTPAAEEEDEEVRKVCVLVIHTLDFIMCTFLTQV